MPKYQLCHSWVSPVSHSSKKEKYPYLDMTDHCAAVLNFRFSLRKDLTGANITNGLAGIVSPSYIIYIKVIWSWM